MKKRITLVLLAACMLVCLLVFSSCGHEHSAKDGWQTSETEHWHVCSGEDCTELLDKAAHVFEVKSTTDATCTEKGSKVEVCSCGYEKVTEIEALGHDKNEEIIAPTCTEAGKTVVTCKREGCDFTEDINVVEANGHDINEEIIAPTCTLDGKIIRTCKTEGCDYSLEIVGAEKTGVHTPEVAVVFEPTCTEDGRQKVICSVCKGDLDNDAIADFNPVIDKLGHTYDNAELADNEELGVRIVLANCDNDGYVERICQRCEYDEDPITLEELNEMENVDEAFKTPLIKWGHKYDKKGETVAPKCEEQGYTVYKCSNDGCESTENRDHTDALPHNFVVNGEPSCATGGKTPYICDRVFGDVPCGATKNDGEVDEEAAKHTKGSVAIEPTCCDKALYVCSVCEAEYEAYDGDAEGAPTYEHVYDIKGESFAPTCGQEGYTLYGCSAGECGTSTKKDFVPKVAHTLGEATEEGIITCTECNRSFVDITAEKISGSDGVCFCGNDPCTCEGISADWEGYTKPSDPESITADTEFVKDNLLIGEGVIVLLSASDSEFVVTIYASGDDAEAVGTITVSGTSIYVDLYEYNTVGKVVITSTQNATVSFYSVI